MRGSSIASVPRDLSDRAKFVEFPLPTLLVCVPANAPSDKAFTFYRLEDQIILSSPAVEYLKMASTEANRISDLVAKLRGTYASGSKAIVAA